MSSSVAGMQNQLFLGTFVHSKKLDELEYLHNTAICVDTAGQIVAVEAECDQGRAESLLYPKLGWDKETVRVTVTKKGQFFFPGFIDTHIHASQYPNTGLFGKTTLLDWLNTYTFPMEASLGASPAKARRVYGRCVRRTLAHGTTTAAYYATIDVAATCLLADLCLAAGQRALVGRVCMDRLGPEYYLDDPTDGGEAADRAVIAHIQKTAAAACNGVTGDAKQQQQLSPLVQPILTPRFAPACTAATLARLGALQRETGLAVQTHVSENEAEVALVAALFPEAASYAEVYDRAGLLGPRTILAHAVHLGEAEAGLVAARGAKVAHCPCSNAALTSGEARVRRLLDRGIAVGLGTDVSGGYCPSVLEAARQALLVANHLAMPRRGLGPGGAKEEEEEKARAKLAVEEVLYLATRGGAEVVGLADRVGAFAPGWEWDAQLVGLGSVPGGEGEGEEGEEGEEGDDDDDDGNVDLFGWETWDERLAKWLFNGDDRNTKKVWVRGRLVHERKRAACGGGGGSSVRG
ncbi:guanine deaminase [Xylariomycetidae sp. FL0641]|nr:guanine deaminase [Xylariomycetidae sp. FL0641]